MSIEPACLGSHPDLFFDDRYADVAKALCGTCQMQSNCAVEGIQEAIFGVWGGLTGQERTTLKKVWDELPHRARLEPPDDSEIIEINWTG